MIDEWTGLCVTVLVLWIGLAYYRTWSHGSAGGGEPPMHPSSHEQGRTPGETECRIALAVGCTLADILMLEISNPGTPFAEEVALAVIMEMLKRIYEQA